MFKPFCCPYRACSQHRAPTNNFYVRFGSYRAKCRPRPVPRFKCRHCLRTFSRQTFRTDYRDQKPHLNAPLFSMIASGIGIRQCSRVLKLSAQCTEHKLRKIGRHLRRANLNLQGQLPLDAELHFDELESYEGERNTRPLSIPVLIESRTRFIIWAESATIRPRGKMSPNRLQKIQNADLKYGKRKDLSRRSIRRALARGARLTQASESVTLSTDEKSSYPGLAKEAFGKGRLIHRKTNSRLIRTVWNPLFAINHEEAIMRDLMGRLRRESWLVSKKRRYLDLALHVHIAFRNLVRTRFNYDEESPAQALGFLPQKLTPTQLLGWRQDWGPRSLHPLSMTGSYTVERLRTSSLAA